MFPSMHTRSFSVLTVLTVFLLSLPEREGHAQSALQIEAGAFLPYNLPMPLSIRQTGEPDISLTARYNSEPFVPPICWVWRVGLWSEERSWELECVHHKIFLANTPPEVGNFSISHGLNQITVNRAWTDGPMTLRVGGGIILAHAESTVRGKTLAEDGGILNLGYHLAGPTLQAAVGHHFTVYGGFLVTAEVKLSAYYVQVPVAGGDARVGGIFAQLSMMLGWRSR